MKPATSTSATSNWDVQHFRLTAFPESPTVDPREWWNLVVGEEPAEAISKPRAGTNELNGQYLDGFLTLVSAPYRIDWNYLPLTTDPNPEVSLPVIGTLDDVSSQMTLLSKKWLKISPPLKRIAIGITCLKGVPNPQEGYEGIGRILPSFGLNYPEISELQVSFNKPRNDEKFGLINRIRKLNVLTMKRMLINAGAGGLTLSGDEAINSPSKHFIRFELDLSSDAEAVGMDPLSDPEAIFDLLLREADDIMKEGK